MFDKLSKPLTDADIFSIYLSVSQDYNHEKNQIKSSYQLAPLEKFKSIYQPVFFNLCNAIYYDPKLKNLSEKELTRVWNVFFSVIYAEEEYQNLDGESREACCDFLEDYSSNKNHLTTDHFIQNNNWTVIDPFVLNAFGEFSVGLFGLFAGISLDLDFDFEVFLVLLVGFVLIMALALLCFFTYYIIELMAESIERFIFNEGWLQGIMTIAAILAGGAGAITLGVFVLMPLILGSIGGPLGFVALGVAILTLSIITSSLTGCLMNAIQGPIITSLNQDAINPHDPYRVQITSGQKRHLIKEGYNLETVLCVMGLLLMQTESANLPAFFTRLNDSSEKVKIINEKLAIIRQLKSGNYPLDTITVDNKVYYLKMPSVRLREDNDLDFPIQLPHPPILPNIGNEPSEDYDSAETEYFFS